MQAAAVILAAGASTRFGSPKQLALIDGRTMLEMVAATATTAGLSPVLAVVPPGLDVPDGVVPVVNDRPEDGISRSIRLGLAAVPAGVEAALILLGDEPLMDVEAIRRAIAPARDHGAEIVATRVGDRLGPPVLVVRDRFDLADAAKEDHGLGPMLRHLSGVKVVEMSASPIDVDTPEDLDRIARADPQHR
ncbi:MAG TPA: nucleotidyltransferase family protein [Candidatus Limnocylindria bacterium]